MTKKQAKKLCIKKFEWIVNNNGVWDYNKIMHDIPGLEKLTNSCGYCELYFRIDCEICPLYIKDVGPCMREEHPYNIWSRHKTKKHAQEVLDLIKLT